MATSDTTSAGLRAGQSGRSRVLALLRSSDAALTIGDVAERLGLHVNSARLHLERLARAGLAERDSRRREGRGRPNVVYTAVPLVEPDATPEEHSGFRLLAEILAAHVAATDPHPAQAAATAGRSWGRALAAGPAADAADEDRAHGDPRSDVVALMERLGFAPRDGRDADAIELHRCPFGQVAGRHSAVVCGVHLGLLQGALEERRAPVDAALEPFVSPRMCRARLVARRPETAVAARTDPGGHRASSVEPKVS